jgi:hypothetical protein
MAAALGTFLQIVLLALPFAVLDAVVLRWRAQRAKHKDASWKTARTVALAAAGNGVGLSTLQNIVLPPLFPGAVFPVALEALFLAAGAAAFVWLIARHYRQKPARALLTWAWVAGANVLLGIALSILLRLAALLLAPRPF